MEYTEKKVLQRRIPLLVSFVDFTDDLQNKILRQGLLTKAQVKKIQKCKGNEERIKEMCQLLIKSPSETAFSQLCFLLESLDLSYVEDVLQSDLLMVNNELPVEEHFIATAYLMAGKILKEDKSMIDAVSQAIAEECQVVKEACRRQMEKKNDPDGEKEQINKKIEAIRRELAYLRPVSGLSKSVSQVTEYSGRRKKMAKPSAGHNDLDENLSALQDDIIKIRESVSEMLEERRNTFEILNEEDNGGKLDEYIRRLVDETKGKGREGRNGILTDRVDAKLRHAKGGNGRIEALEIHCQEQEEAIRNLQRHLLETQQELEVATAEVDYWKKRSEVLEKARRHGYIATNTNEPGKKGTVTVSKAEFTKDPDKYDPELRQLKERVDVARGRSADLRSRTLRTSDINMTNGDSADVLSCTNSCRLHCSPCLGMCTKHCH